MEPKRLIDAEALVLKFMAELCGYGTCVPTEGQIAVRLLIDYAPTIDAVEVVRCKDCRYYNCDCMSPGTGWCECLERGEYNNHFCSYGEPKEGADNG